MNRLAGLAIVALLFMAWGCGSTESGTDLNSWDHGWENDVAADVPAGDLTVDTALDNADVTDESGADTADSGNDDNPADSVSDSASDSASEDVWPDIAEPGCATAGQAGFSAGMGIADVSGGVGTMLGGYGFCMGAADYCRYSEGTHDPLLSRAFAIMDNNTCEFVIIISNDLVGVLRYDIDMIQEAAVNRFRREFGIRDFDPTRIIIAATHTHHSTDTMGLWGPLDGSGRDEEYAAFMREQILDAAVAAYRDLKPVNIYWTASGSAPNYDDDKYADDETIHSLRFEDKATGKTRFTMNRWSAHPTNYPQALQAFSASHPGVFCHQMESLTEAPAAYFQGMIGSVYPESYEGCQMDDVFPEGYQDPDLNLSFVSDVTCIGTKVAEAANAALADEVEVPETGIVNRYKKFSFHPEAEYSVMLGYTMFDFAEMGPLHFEVPPKEERESNPNWTMDTQFNWVTIGDINIITVPGEGFPLFGQEIVQAMAPLSNKVITIGSAQDWLGYIPALTQWQEDDAKLQYNKSLSAGRNLPVRFLEELSTLINAEGDGAGSN